MSSRKLVAAVFALIVSFAPSRGFYTDLEASVVGIAGSTVTVSVHNPTSGSQLLRISVTVLYTDNTVQTLDSGNFTVTAGQTAGATISGSKPIAGIIDDPEPINPL